MLFPRTGILAARECGNGAVVTADQKKTSGSVQAPGGLGNRTTLPEGSARENLWKIDR